MNVYDRCGKYPETVCWMHPVADMRFLVGLPCGSMGSEERSRCRSCGAPGGNLRFGCCTKWGGRNSNDLKIHLFLALAVQTKNEPFESMNFKTEGHLVVEALLNFELT